VQYGRRVWNLQGEDNDIADAAIQKTIGFLKSLGVPVSLADVNLTPNELTAISKAHAQRGSRLGEHQAIGPKEITEIIQLAA